ncbi:hypothetical protein [Maridesulfovibrio ferrireducens]|uniref:hypothetical protein n=1 Tax=Maridesulfovibrio ferrireducens TaxID=246191 RepID=UPI001A2EED1D|nr:hypothetical protein [Maridesulfovibrio ferrireducens]MBI9110365.1 hypothetical protein [Maridesulfovibrio ferrireducens]
MPKKNIAWDGISFEIPSKFEVSGIDKRFIQLDNGEHPCVEIRWYDSGKTYKQQNYFRQLAKKIEVSSGIKIESSVLPSSWKKPLERFHSTAFYWQSDLSTGRGVMFYCPKSAQVMLIQFIGKGGEQLEDAAISLFSSIKFYNNEEFTPWRIYDMEATLPVAYKLDSFEFKPGRFKIILCSENESISLYRISPADTLLKERSLGDFSKEFFKDDINRLDLSIAELQFDSGATCMFGQDKKPSAAKITMSKLSSKRRPFGQIEARYTKDANRIQAVLICSRTTIPDNRMQNIFENYSIVQ